MRIFRQYTSQTEFSTKEQVAGKIVFLTVLPFSETWVDAIVHQVLADQAVWVRSLGTAFGPSGQIISGEHEVICDIL